MPGRSSRSDWRHKKVGHNVIPHKSGVHRLACFALYRLLLRQIPHSPLDHTLLRAVFRAEFQQDARLRQHAAIRQSMQRGYQTGYLLSMLSDGGTALPQAPKPQYPAGGISPLTLRHNSSSHKQQDKSSLVSSLNSYLAHLATTYPVPTPPKQPPPCLVPYPDGNKILNRPLPLAQLRGRRHIPILINAGGFPMLRVKKPQPPLLSKILRDKLATRQRRGDQILELDALRVWAVDEDIWDRDMRMQQQQQQHHHHHHQTSEKVAEGKGEGKYVDTIDELVVMIRGKLEMEERKQRALAQRFWEIVRLETKLVGEEKEARRVEKVGIWIEKMKSMVEGKGGVWVAHRGVEREKTMME